MALVNSNCGEGFANGDQGHPAYRVGREGKIHFETWGDSPDRNKLFQMMNELSVALNEAEMERPTNIEYVFCWADFCRLATDAYDRKRDRGG
jgi:hypothetical protein